MLVNSIERIHSNFPSLVVLEVGPKVQYQSLFDENRPSNEFDHVKALYV